MIFAKLIIWLTHKKCLNPLQKYKINIFLVINYNKITWAKKFSKKMIKEKT